MPSEKRQHPRFPLALLVVLSKSGQAFVGTTLGISMGGISVAIDDAARFEREQQWAIRLTLPAGEQLDAVAVVRNVMPSGIVGCALLFEGPARARWQALIDEEAATGSLWRMIGRAAVADLPVDSSKRDAVLATHRARVTIGDDRYGCFAVGENGEAYRLCFNKHPSEDATASMFLRSTGISNNAKAAVARVLVAPLTIMFPGASLGQVRQVRVVELVRGGFAYFDATQTRMLLCGLVAGEMLVVAKNDEPIFPFLTPADEEAIACDAFPATQTQPVFGHGQVARAPAPITLPPMPQLREHTTPLDVVRMAQAAATDVQLRRYGDRDIQFHPSVWAKLRGADGQELLGPTLKDGDRICILALSGPKTPRVVRLSSDADVTVLARR